MGGLHKKHCIRNDDCYFVLMSVDVRVIESDSSEVVLTSNSGAS